MWGRVFFVIGIFLSFNACTQVDIPYRTLGPMDAKCTSTDEYRLWLEARHVGQNKKISNYYNNASFKESDDSWGCFRQFHRVKNSTGNKNTRYSLSFIEFPEVNDVEDPIYRSIYDLQRKTFLEHLTENQKKYLIVYIHGWRHDAARNDTDVKKFRKLLAYSSSFLDQRCESQERYCDAEVTGLYIGWRGRGFVDCANFLCVVPAAFTIWGRKSVSEDISKNIVRFLKKAENTLRDRNKKRGDTFFTKEKMLVMGHSLGGNILATGLQNLVEERISKHNPGDVMDAPIGDLTLLLNPAAEARKWTSIQREMDKKRKKHPIKNLFSKRQKPVFISLTSACNWNGTEKSIDLQRKIYCDTSTAYIFPIHRLLLGDWNAEGYRTIGHLDPVSGRNVGTTHELEINGSVNAPTTYKNAFKKNVSKCEVADSWLWKVKERHNNIFGKESPRDWDAGSVFTKDYKNWKKLSGNIRNNQFNLSPVSLEKEVTAQFREGVFRGALGSRITPIHNPFWNIRALDTAVKSHNGFTSYPTWCAINQIILDDIVRRPPV